VGFDNERLLSPSPRVSKLLRTLALYIFKAFSLSRIHRNYSTFAASSPSSRSDNASLASKQAQVAQLEEPRPAISFAALYCIALACTSRRAFAAAEATMQGLRERFAGGASSGGLAHCIVRSRQAFAAAEATNARLPREPAQVALCWRSLIWRSRSLHCITHCIALYRFARHIVRSRRTFAAAESDTAASQETGSGSALLQECRLASPSLHCIASIAAMYVRGEHSQQQKATMQVLQGNPLR